MSKLSITACSFCLRKSNSKNINGVYNLNEGVSISDTDGNQQYFADCSLLFELFFENHSLLTSYADREQSFQCQYDSKNCIETDTFKMIYAKINSGMYGSSSEIIDGNTKALSYQKKASDIDVRPFYLAIVFPKDNQKVTVQKGMLIFQNVGQYGIKTITTSLMQQFFSDKLKISLNCMTIAPSLFIKKNLQRENVKKIRMIKNFKSGDVADNQALGYGVEVREIGNLNFTESKWGMIKSSIRHAAGDKNNLFEFENKKYDNLKVVVEIGNRTRTISVHNLDNLSIIEDIPDDIRMLTGHPDEKLLMDYLTKVATEYLEEMVLSVE